MAFSCQTSTKLSRRWLEFCVVHLFFKGNLTFLLKHTGIRHLVVECLGQPYIVNWEGYLLRGTAMQTSSFNALPMLKTIEPEVHCWFHFSAKCC